MLLEEGVEVGELPVALEWTANCSVDKMTDKVNCYISVTPPIMCA
jgi:hypothetical protein